MNVVFRKSFVRDLKRVKDQSLLDRIGRAIERVETASSPREVRDLRKIAGVDGFYRIRVREYRLGVAIEGDHFEFVRGLSRRELYRFFP